ncbi:MAG TPA: hypothetical protein VHP33_20960 [Polyangiaceae bacterium]|nr:hypothetical protein [Polyangiaceae bacterium]
MKAWSWVPLGLLAFACSGAAFTSDGAGDGGQGAEGGSESGASSGGASNKAGNASGGSGQSAGSTSKGGSSGKGGSMSAGGVGGDLVSGGKPPIAGSTSAAGTGTAGTSSAGANTGGTGNPDPVDKVCPKTQPVAGGGCAGELLCTYTSDVRPECRPYAKCENGKWAITKPECEALNACPPLQVGKACDAQPPCMLSADQGIYCVCTGCTGTGGPCSTDTVWECAASAGGVGCPALPPNVGQTCAGEVQCGYGSCATGNAISARCDGSVWDWELLACPL